MGCKKTNLNVGGLTSVVNSLNFLQQEPIYNTQSQFILSNSTLL